LQIPPFQPFIRNAHLLTILGNFWRRPVTGTVYPVVRRLYETEPGVRVAVDEQRPPQPRAQAILVHGLEGSSESGYLRSLARDLLEADVAVHRLNMRSCGGTEHLAPSNYHAGQTSDTRFVLETLAQEGLPVFLVGFSLGGNMSLKLAGELGDAGLLTGVCAVSTPIDLSACADRLQHPSNRLYQERFLLALKARIRRRHAQQPDLYDVRALKQVRSIRDFDDCYTAKLFGFGTAENYFRTQSSQQFLERIRVPALLIQAKDDPMIPFEVYGHPGIARNPLIRLVATEHGGHVGFIARHNPRFWTDPLITAWVRSILAANAGNKRAAEPVL
jgi:predicted alpha/beta-fold hydrolase